MLMSKIFFPRFFLNILNTAKEGDEVVLNTATCAWEYPTNNSELIDPYANLEESEEEEELMKHVEKRAREASKAIIILDDFESENNHARRQPAQSHLLLGTSLVSPIVID